MFFLPIFLSLCSLSGPNLAFFAAGPSSLLSSSFVDFGDHVI